MNMLKRMASIVIIAVMMLQIAAFAAPVPEDVIGTEYEAAASMLCALNIMVGDGTNFNPDDNITRAEFAQIMMKSLALDSAAEAFQPVGVFTDVATSNIFAPAIELGVGIGAIKGYGDGTFGPDDNVLGTEAVKMMVFAAGHDVTAESNGGYPSGYMVVAQEIGMLKGISGIDFSVPMTRGQAAVLCANTLKVDMKKKITEGGKIKYVQYADVNLLSEKHNVYKVEGLVSANDVTSLWASSSLREGRVQIETGTSNGIYIAGETTISDALGKYVKAYYKYDKDTEEGTIVSYEITSNKNESVTANLENVEFDTVTNSFVEFWVDKDNDNRTTEIDIAATPSIIFNGATRTRNNSVAATFDEIRGKSGEVTFIDNNGDGNMDILNIVAYDTIVVKQINSKDYILTDEIGTYNSLGNNVKKTVTIDVASSSMTANIVDIDGGELEFDDISVGDVLSVALSDEGTGRQYAKVIVSQESVDGEITSIGKSNGKYTISIDGEKYEITDSYFEYITKGQGFNVATTALKIKIGNSGEFFLDSFGRIAYDSLEGVSEDAIFGFLRTSAPSKGANVTLMLRIYADGEYADYATASKVEIDGTVCKGETEIANGLQTSLDYMNSQIAYYDGESDMTPLLFELDANDNIKKIDTPYMGQNESEYSLQPVKGKTLAYEKGVTYLKSTSSLGGTTYKINAATPIIQIPADFSDIDNAKELSSIKPDKLSTDSKGTPYMQMLTTEPDSYNVEYAVIKDAAGGTEPKTSSEQHDLQILVISEVIQCLDNEGNKTIKIIGLMEGAQKEYVIDYDYYSSGKFYDAIWKAGIKGYEATAAALEDPARKTDVVLPGDAISVYPNASGEIEWSMPTYLIDAKVFRSYDHGGTDSFERYRARDIAVVNEIDGNEIRANYLIPKKASSGNANATAKLEINNGFVTKVSSTEKSVPALTLRNEENTEYIFGDTGMKTDEVYDASKFKIMVYDASREAGMQVYAGTTSDLYDTTGGSEPASLVIMQFRGGSNGITTPRGMYIIKY